jgi:hypothetical protein
VNKKLSTKEEKSMTERRQRLGKKANLKDDGDPTSQKSMISSVNDEHPRSRVRRELDSAILKVMFSHSAADIFVSTPGVRLETIDLRDDGRSSDSCAIPQPSQSAVTGAA